MEFKYTPAPTSSGVELRRFSYAQQRLRQFGLTMIVMGISFILYYLGLFGRVDGPLDPAQLGAHLALWGLNKTHILLMAVCLTLLTIAWNWIYNLAAFLRGTRRTCSRIDDRGNRCRKPVGAKQTIRTADGRPLTRYVCALGHKRVDADFEALKKGPVGHMLWAISVILTGIVFYASYC